jgi:hypothetical protein
VWDPGTPAERRVEPFPGNPHYLQVPEDLPPGYHFVALRNDAGVSEVQSVLVLPARGVFPQPLVADVTFLDARDRPDGNMDLEILVFGANLDPDAAMELNGEVIQGTSLWSALTEPYQWSHDPSTFGMPVYHYVQVRAEILGAVPGSSMTFFMINRDGARGWGVVRVPASTAELDSDGDGLLDAWEVNGYPAPTGEVIDLPGMGCDPRHMDLLVESDWIPAARPMDAAWSGIVDIFERSPVLSPDGRRGIRLHVDRGQGGAFRNGGPIEEDHETMGFAPVTEESPPGYVSFYDYKGRHFDPARAGIFRYFLWGRDMLGNTRGVAEVRGNDAMAAFIESSDWSLEVAQIGIFVHEFGHNLGLEHGGVDDLVEIGNFPPNQASTMSYRYSKRGISRDGDFAPDGVHDYSRGDFATIREDTAQEAVGLCDGRPLDLNEDGDVTDHGPLDANKDGDATDWHYDVSQWHHLRFLPVRAGNWAD